MNKDERKRHMELLSAENIILIQLKGETEFELSFEKYKCETTTDGVHEVMLKIRKWHTGVLGSI